jgi:hypothetical protein
MREGPKLTSKPITKIAGRIRLPRKTRNVQPRYPALPEGTTGSGGWAGEFLIDTDGKVVAVWATSEPHLEPQFPAFADAIVHAIRQWRFEPLIVSGEGVPACASVSISIHWS